MEGRYRLFDPKNDFAFKSMFTFDDKSKKALIIFLNAVIQPKENKKITNITYVNTYVNTEYPDEKKSIMDIKVVTQDGESINIEMQVNDDDAYVDRTTYYAATLIAEQPLKGKSYDELKRCVVINLLNFSLFDQTQRYHTTFRFEEIHEKFTLTDKLEIHYIELSKFKDYENKNLDALEKWLVFFKDVTDESKKDLIDKIREEEEGINMAAESLERISQDTKMRIEYQERQKWIMDLKSKEEYARKKGIEEKEVEIIKNMISLNMPIDIIAKSIGKTVEYVNRILEEKAYKNN